MSEFKEPSGLLSLRLDGTANVLLKARTLHPEQDYEVTVTFSMIRPEVEWMIDTLRLLLGEMTPH